MRLIVLLSLLTLTACTIREESFAPSSEPSSSGLSLNTPDMNTPAAADSRSCPGGFARGSDLQIYRDGTQDLFCE
jgi:hypothetical protein